MGGFFGTIKKSSCVTDLFYGVDYNSHMGTKRAGMATFDNGIFPARFTTSPTLISVQNSNRSYPPFREIRG